MRSDRLGRGRALPARRVALAGVLAVTAATGCATVTSPLPPAARPAAASPAPAAPAASRPAPDCGDPTVGLRPPAAMPAPVAMPAGSTMAAIAAKGYLTVGLNTDVPPFGLIDPNEPTEAKQFKGFDADIAREVAKAIFGPDNVDAHIRFRTITAAERIPVIRDGSVDIVTATMTINCQRRTQVDFSVPYYDATARVLVLKNSPYRGMDDLGGRRVCASAGTTSLQHIVDAPSHPVPYPLPTDSDCLVALQNGDVDAISTDDTILLGMVAQDPQTKVVGPSLANEPDGVAVSLEHPDLTRFIDGVLARIEQDGTWAAIYQRWLGFSGIPGTPPTAQYRD
jgi:polar amino acid transport system substrate-binding protein